MCRPRGGTYGPFCGNAKLIVNPREEKGVPGNGLASKGPPRPGLACEGLTLQRIRQALLRGNIKNERTEILYRPFSPTDLKQSPYGGSDHIPQKPIGGNRKTQISARTVRSCGKRLVLRPVSLENRTD